MNTIVLDICLRLSHSRLLLLSPTNLLSSYVEVVYYRMHANRNIVQRVSSSAVVVADRQAVLVTNYSGVALEEAKCVLVVRKVRAEAVWRRTGLAQSVHDGVVA